MNFPLIIGDTDALIATLNPTDNHNDEAIGILQKIAYMKANLFFPTTTIAEAVTALRRKLSLPEISQLLVEKCKNGEISLMPVDSEIIAIAANFYDIKTSKQNTFFDAVVASVAKKYDASFIFSFDKWYEKLGLQLTNRLKV